MSSPVPRVEEVVLEKGRIGLGFNIRGGTDNIFVGSDPGIFVALVNPNGAAGKDGRLQPGDKILEINNHDLREVPHQTAVTFFHDAGDVVRLLIERGSEKRTQVPQFEMEPLPSSSPSSATHLSSSKDPPPDSENQELYYYCCTVL